MKVQLQTNLTASYATRANLAKNAGVSKVNFGASEMDKFLAADSAEAKSSKIAIKAQADTELSNRIKNAINDINLNEVVSEVNGTPLTARTLLEDLYELTKNGAKKMFYHEREDSSAYLNKFKSPRVQKQIESYVGKLSGDGIFASCHLPGKDINRMIYLTDFGSAVLEGLFKAAKAAKL